MIECQREAMGFMKTIFATDGYKIDGGELSYKQLYDLAFQRIDSDKFDAGALFLIDIAKSFVFALSKTPDVSITRVAPEPGQQELRDLLYELPFCIGVEFVNVAWVLNIWHKLSEIFNAEFSQTQQTVEEYLKSKDSSLTVAGRVFFHLVQTHEESYPFAFMATYSTKQNDQAVHIPLKYALNEFNYDESSMLSLLSAVSKAADKSTFISDLIESGELMHPLKFSPQDAYTFLREVPLYEESGVICRIPDFWKKKGRLHLSVSLGSKEPPVLGMQELIAFSPFICLGDTEVSEEELRQLAELDGGLAFFKGKWVEVDKAKISEVLTALEKINKNKGLTLAEALQTMSGIKSLEETNQDDVSITVGEWLNSVVSKLCDPQKLTEVKIDKTFQAQLRCYQQRGLNWLSFMKSLGFGALLADDMGLGKTVQVLALLNNLKKDKAKSLLVVPASLITNWQKETQRFAPNLKLQTLHGTSKRIDIENFDIFMTTYSTLSKIDLKDIDWDLLILDEAQAIKNATSQQTKAVKILQSKSRIAITGTPIENRLSDLWSIFDFLNKGMLGNAQQFSKFTETLKVKPEGYSKLRKAISPFILRRLKTDKTIISDLPEKNETKQYVSLTKKQVVLYNELVKDLEQALSESDDMKGIKRKGKILVALTKFKQICNHPAQYTGSGNFLPFQSGKFETLAEICTTIKEKHESVLVFTQFKEMCSPLMLFLTTVFGRDGAMIHGSVPAKKRGEIVERFNTEYVPFMVLSLKAGGVGLNLTAANHVIHFDRWWNPAVENQATDRAFRIGQRKDVFVHKLISTGTIEEKIDLIIENKLKLSKELIPASSGESWITEMSNEDIVNLFKFEA